MTMRTVPFPRTPAEVRECLALAAKGAIAVDNSGAFRMDPEVPLVVPEVNARAIDNRPRGIVAMPCGPAIIMLPVLATLHEHWNLTHVTATSMQAVTGAGKRAPLARIAPSLAATAGSGATISNAASVTSTSTTAVMAPPYSVTSTRSFASASAALPVGKTSTIAVIIANMMSEGCSTV